MCRSRAGTKRNQTTKIATGVTRNMAENHGNGGQNNPKNRERNHLAAIHGARRNARAIRAASAKRE